MIKEKSTKTIYLLQDLGFLGFLMSIVAIIIVICAAEQSERIESLIMFLILCVPIMLSVYKMPMLAYCIAGLQILGYTIYKIYMWSAWSEKLSFVAYAWILIPVVSIVCAQMFMYGLVQLELKNEILRDQVEELVLIDPLTGLYNQRGLYNDLTRNIALSKRNNTSIGIMVVRLKYEQELRQILSLNQFNRLKQVMAEIVEDSLRIEDRLYSIDENGTLVIFMHCDKSGAEVVENRLKSIISEKYAFQEVIESTIKVEVKVGYVQYDQEKITDAIDFLQQAENEVQYDV